MRKGLGSAVCLAVLALTSCRTRYAAPVAPPLQPQPEAAMRIAPQAPVPAELQLPLAPGCDSGSSRCTCWPDFPVTVDPNVLTAGQMLSGIIQEADTRSKDMQSRMAVRSAWLNVRNLAQWCHNYGVNNPTLTCQQHLNRVQACYAAVFPATPIPAGDPPPQICATELNHDDPVSSR
jgi:hypothetical protein